MNRRELLKVLAAGGIIVAGELWIPGAKKIFLPPKSIWLRQETLVVSDGDTLTVDASIGHSRYFVELVRADGSVREMWHGERETNLTGLRETRLVNHFERV